MATRVDGVFAVGSRFCFRYRAGDACEKRKSVFVFRPFVCAELAFFSPPLLVGFLGFASSGSRGLLLGICVSSRESKPRDSVLAATLKQASPISGEKP